MAPAIGLPSYYVKFVDVEKKHVQKDGDRLLKWTGRLVLDDAKNPDSVPSEVYRCRSSRQVFVERKNSSDEWVALGQTFTNEDGRFSKRVADRKGTYRLRAAYTLASSEAQCAEEIKAGLSHNH
jgi:hypothetical protein